VVEAETLGRVSSAWSRAAAASDEAEGFRVERFVDDEIGHLDSSHGGTSAALPARRPRRSSSRTECACLSRETAEPPSRIAREARRGEGLRSVPEVERSKISGTS
jgi:hypothetical protein